MAAVVKAVKGVVDAVVNVVEDVVESVGEAVEQVGRFVENVVETVADTVQAVIDDPLPTLLSMAGSFVGIPPAVTMAAITAARGGDLEDIALSAGTAYYAPQVGNALSSTVNSSFINAGMNETFSRVASDSISKGFVNGTISEVRGGDFNDGFAGGFTGGMISGGVGEVASYVKPDVIAMAQNNGLDLRDATAVYNAGTRAFSTGLTSEVTGRGDFITSFTNSAVGSGVDYGARSLNASIDEQFKSAITQWGKEDGEDSLIADAVESTAEGAGIPDELVNQVAVSNLGFDGMANAKSEETTPSLTDVLADNTDATSQDTSGETAVSDISVLSDNVLANAPEADTVENFYDLLGKDTNQDTNEDVNIDTTVLADANEPIEVAAATDEEVLPSDVLDIYASTSDAEKEKAGQPKGALAIASDAAQDLDVARAEVKSDLPITEAPIAANLLTSDLPTEQPEGGLNAMSVKDAAQKMADSLGLKTNDITKPVVANVANLIKSTLKVGKKPVPRRPVAPPKSGLQMAKAAPKRPTPPPIKMDVAKLTPIQKAPQPAPAQKLSSSANLTPVSDIASLTSMLKKSG